MDPIFKPLTDEEKIWRMIDMDGLKDNGDGTYDYLKYLSLDNLFLETLSGLPKIRTAHRDFYCKNNRLISLKGGPMNALDAYVCRNNQLESLSGGPNSTKKNFDCSYNKITSLAGGPRGICWGYDCSKNQLKSLEYSPEEVIGFYSCAGNPLETLEGMPKFIGWDFILLDCPKANDMDWLELELRKYAGVIRGGISTDIGKFYWDFDRKKIEKRIREQRWTRYSNH